MPEQATKYEVRPLTEAEERALAQSVTATARLSKPNARERDALLKGVASKRKRMEDVRDDLEARLRYGENLVTKLNGCIDATFDEANEIMGVRDR